MRWGGKLGPPACCYRETTAGRPRSPEVVFMAVLKREVRAFDRRRDIALGPPVRNPKGAPPSVFPFAPLTV
jgi:hypothetical protein